VPELAIGDRIAHQPLIILSGGLDPIVHGLGSKPELAAVYTTRGQTGLTAQSDEDPVLQKNDEWLMGNPVADPSYGTTAHHHSSPDRIRAPSFCLQDNMTSDVLVAETRQNEAKAARKTGQQSRSDLRERRPRTSYGERTR